MFWKNKKGRRGMTLTEVMITVAITGIIFAVGPQMFIQLNRFIKINQKKIEIQREARLILSTINRNLRMASSPSITIDRFASNQPYCSRIRFQRVDGMAYTFYQQGSRLVMTQTGPGISTSKILTSSLKYMAFVPPRSEDLSMISVSVTLEVQIPEAKTKALHMASEKVMVMNE
ncbi:MAG: prepilin-type N-terminal cleavage/methylation domain-containing protein [Elusimicrobiota bacterium]